MTTFAVSGMRPAKSDAQRAEQLFEVHDTAEEAMKVAENWLRIGCIDISVWKQYGIPTLKTVVEWEKHNGTD